MLVGGREHIDDAAADRDVATPADQVLAGVADLDELGEQLIGVTRIAGPQPDRRQVPEPAHDRLEQAPDWGDDHGERPRRVVARVRVRQPAQHSDSLPDRVGARGQALVRQRFPAGEAGDAAVGQEGSERRRQVLGFAGGRGDGEHEPPEPGRDGRGEDGAQGGRGDKINAFQHRAARPCPGNGCPGNGCPGNGCPGNGGPGGFGGSRPGRRRFQGPRLEGTLQPRIVRDDAEDSGKTHGVPVVMARVVTAWVVCGPAPGRRESWRRSPNSAGGSTVLTARQCWRLGIRASPGMHETPALGRDGGSCCVTTPQVYVPAGPVCP